MRGLLTSLVVALAGWACGSEVVRIAETDPEIRLLPERARAKSIRVPLSSLGYEVVYPTGSAIFVGERWMSGVNLRTGKHWTHSSANEGFVIAYGPYVLVFEVLGEYWRLRMVHGATGEIVWETTAEAPYKRVDGTLQPFRLAGRPFVLEHRLYFGFGQRTAIQLAAVDCRTGATKTGPLEGCLRFAPELKGALFAIHEMLIWNGVTIPQEKLPTGQTLDAAIVSRQGAIVSTYRNGFLYEAAKKGFAVLQLEDIIAGEVKDALGGAGDGPVWTPDRWERSYYGPFLWMGNQVLCSKGFYRWFGDVPESKGSIILFDIRKRTEKELNPIRVRRYWPTSRGLIAEGTEGQCWRLSSDRFKPIDLKGGKAVGVGPHGVTTISNAPAKNGMALIKFIRI